MTSTVRLVPVALPGEILQLGIRARPELELRASSTMTLGKNAVTKIIDPSVNRSVCKIEYRDSSDESSSSSPKLRLTNIKHPVWINGTRVASKTTPIQSGDTIELLKNRYAYRVVALDAIMRSSPRRKKPRSNPTKTVPQQPSTTAASTSKPVTPPCETFSDALPRTVAEDLYCPLCLGLHVDPVALVPCGHSFCRECVQPIDDHCPTCRGNITSRVPNLSLGSFVHGMAASTTLLPYQDVLDWDQRLPAAKRIKRNGGTSQTDAICLD